MQAVLAVVQAAGGETGGRVGGKVLISTFCCNLGSAPDRWPLTAVEGQPLLGG